MVDLEQEADFMGKEALKKIKAEGVSQKLVGVDIEGEPLGTYIDSEMIDFFPVSVGGSGGARDVRVPLPSDGEEHRASRCC